MAGAKIYKCQFCNYTSSDKRKMGYHYENIHKSLIRDDMTGYQWFYYLLTKKDHGSCVMCKNNTQFNEITMKYCRYCDNPACKQKYKEERDRRMMGKYGKLYLTDDPEQQKKMLANRRISGEYRWSDGSYKFTYTGSYELDFLKYLDIRLHWNSSDLMAPSPNTYIYEYAGNKHFYMPDFFIPSLNLEIEIKDDGSAKNINQQSREKDKIKDELMRSNSNYINYLKIVNKNYSEFITLLKGA